MEELETFQDHVDDFNHRATAICTKVNSTFPNLSVHADLVSEQAPDRYGAWYDYYTRKSMNEVKHTLHSLISQLTRYNLVAPVTLPFKSDWKDIDHALATIEDRINKY